MADPNDPNDPNNDLEGFETFDEPMDDEQMLADETMDEAMDADFQDVGEDDVDADVFGEGEPEPLPAKKKTNWFNIGVAVVAITVAGGLVWSKLGPTIMGGADSAPMASMDNSVPSPNNDPNAAAQAALNSGLPTPNAPAQGGLLDDPEKFSKLAQNAPTDQGPAPQAPVIVDPFAGLSNEPTKAAQAEAKSTPVPMPTPITTETAPDTNLVPAAPVTPVENAAVTTPLPTPPLATTPSEPVAVVQTTETVMPAPVDDTSATVLPNVASTDNSAVDAKMSAMEERLNQMDAKIDTAVEKITNAAPVDAGALASIQTSLERLEQRLDNMGNTRSASAPRAASNDDYAEPAPVRKKTVKKASKPKAQATAQDEPYSPRTQAVNISAPATNSTGWELRGATSGRAIIARGNDIREVGVGETVPGLGEVMGVAQVNGAWVVQGSNGRLSQ